MATLDEFTRSLSRHDGGYRMIFERTFATGIDDLWDAVTSHDRLSRWLGSVLEADDAGKELLIDLGGDDDHARVTVTGCDKPRHCQVNWRWQDEPTCIVTVDLEPITGSSTRLTLSHDRLRKDSHVIGYGGGWEWCLLSLDAAVTGTTVDQQSLSDHESRAQDSWRALVERG